MIVGTVRNREALIEIEVSGRSGQVERIEAVIDTGFNGSLTLPRTLISSLQLSFAGHRRGMLADGSITRLDIYSAIALWHGQQKEVLISEAAGTPLIGMSLLEGNRLTIVVHDSGDVVIEKI